MKLEIKHFIAPQKGAKELACLVTDGVKKKNDEGKMSLRYDLQYIKVKDFNNYELFPDANHTKAIIPTVRIKK